MDPSTSIFVGPDEAVLQMFEDVTFDEGAQAEELTSMFDAFGMQMTVEDEKISSASLAEYIVEADQLSIAESIAPGIRLSQDRSNKILVYSAAANKYSKVPPLTVLKHAFKRADPSMNGGAVAAFQFVDIAQESTNIITQTWDYKRGYGLLDIRYLHCKLLRSADKAQAEFKKALFSEVQETQGMQMEQDDEMQLD